MFGRAITTIIGLSTVAQSQTVGLWSFAEAGVVEGQAVTAASNSTSVGTLDALPESGTPLYSSDVPADRIFNPVSGETYDNRWSLDVTAANSRVSTADSENLNGSFTIEFFIKLVGEPGSYETFLRRYQTADLAWKFDFDHAANTGFGKIRSRWDTPAGAPDGIAENGVDENVNFVMRPPGNRDSDHLYIDTGAKDATGADVGPQNTGLVSDYVFDPASGNPNDADVALQGDGSNDVPDWHHVAMSFDEASQQVSFYFDYRLVDVKTLSDSEGDGYTHPAAGLQFGKFNTNPGGLFLDEVRYSIGLLSPGEFLRDADFDPDLVTGYWRMEDDEAIDGGEISEVTDQSTGGNDASVANGTPLYSSDVPAAVIFDPLAGQNLPNQFSLDASGANARLRVPNSASLNTSFTLEFFMKLVGEPGGYQSFLRRQESGSLRWQIDFDHAAAGGYGRLRTRFDTPNENTNFVLGPTGGGAIPESQRIWIDTDAGDGLVASYDDPDWAADGDGINDQPGWHHAAISFDQETGVIRFYYDYELLQTRTLSDSEANGYTHPNAAIDFGKFAASDYEMYLDEVRYAGTLLEPFQFLQAGAVANTPLVITSLGLDPGTGFAIVTWASDPGQTYLVERSVDLEVWDQVGSETATGDTTSLEDANAPVGLSKIFYRVTRTNQL
jgi:hypothetical protein